MIRQPAVAGQFYPANPQEVEAELARWMVPGQSLRHALAVMVPHAGWAYSGATAALVYSQVRIPDRVILIGPNHRGLGSDYAVYDAGVWRTPLGDVPVAEPLAAELLDNCDLLAEDPKAHAAEHCLEVQLPMLRRANPNIHIVPIIVAGTWPESGGRSKLREIGLAIATTIKEYGQPVLMVASTDLNHYESQDTGRAKDQRVLDAVLKLDEEAMMDRVIESQVSMCGVAPTYIILVAAKKLGAQRAALVDYRTSGDVTGDLARVVGYGGVIIE